jgi:hypothetical protein
MEEIRYVNCVDGRIRRRSYDWPTASQATNPAGPIPIHVMNLHKHLIALFAEYDALTKRVRAYPCSPGSARERVQVAIARQASLFMAREAGVLQVSFVWFTPELDPFTQRSSTLR